MSEFLVSITEWHLKLWLNSFLIFESQAVDLKFSLKLIDGFMVLDFVVTFITIWQILDAPFWVSLLLASNIFRTLF